MMNWIWLGAVVAFGVLEAATAALVSIWFVGGAAVALLASFLGAALWLQIALFLAVSVGILAAVRPLIKRANAKTVPTNLDRVIGCTKWQEALVFGVLISATIETSQLITMRGLFEWDDMIHNGLGCMVGAVLVNWMIGFFGKKDER